MQFKLRFKEEAWQEWNKLDAVIREQFAKKLHTLKENPRIETAKLSGIQDCYKIKWRKAGYRLIYELRDTEVVIIVIDIGKRERNSVYKTAIKRL